MPERLNNDLFSCSFESQCSDTWGFCEHFFVFYFNQTDQIVNHTKKKSEDDNNKRKRERNAKKKRKCSESPETFGMCSRGGSS